MNTKRYIPMDPRFMRKVARKYHNQPTVFDGIAYHSALEARYAEQLTLLRRAGEIKKWDRQVRIPLYGENGSEVCVYVIDFIVTHADGTIEYVEVKGMATETWRIKWALLKDKLRNDTNIRLTVVRKSGKTSFMAYEGEE